MDTSHLTFGVFTPPMIICRVGKATPWLIGDVQEIVARHYQLTLRDMRCARRDRCIARPRQVAMFLAREMTDKSLPEIGRRFGGRDHTTVMHAIRRVTELIRTDPDIAEDVRILRGRLSG